MSFQIKISGIDKNKNKHIWVDINNEDIKEESGYIRYKNNSKKQKIETVETVETKFKTLSIEETNEKPTETYTLNVEQSKILDIIKKKNRYKRYYYYIWYSRRWKNFYNFTYI